MIENSKEPNDTIGYLFLFIFTPFLLLAGGWVRSHLWKWFLVPLGLPPIGTLAMAGILLLSRSLWITNGEPTPPAKVLAKTFVNLTFTLGFGYLIHRL